MSRRLRGTIVRWSKRGYGFVSSPELTQDVWSHVRYIEDSIIDVTRSLPVGMEIEFEPREVDGELHAVAVTRPERTVAPTTGYTILAGLPAGSARFEVRERYWIDGRVYETWDDVPERYKKPPRNEADKPPPALLHF